MSEGTPRTVMAEENHLQAPQRRRSPRFGSPGALREAESKMAPGEKRSITVRKIVPRKTTAVTGSNKENRPRTPDLQGAKGSTRRSPSSAGRRRQRGPEPTPGGPASSAGRRTEPQPAMPSAQPAMPSPIRPADPPDPVWTQKVRRSYSRLSDSSLLSPGPRETLFGFEKLSTPEVRSRAEPVRSRPDLVRSRAEPVRSRPDLVRSRAEPVRSRPDLVRSRPDLSRSSLEVSGSFASMLEADECGPEPDPNIPGVTVVKEKRKKRKVKQINTEELEVLAARMNQEFREAEQFELVVE